MKSFMLSCLLTIAIASSSSPSRAAAPATSPAADASPTHVLHDEKRTFTLSVPADWEQPPHPPADLAMAVMAVTPAAPAAAPGGPPQRGVLIVQVRPMGNVAPADEPQVLAETANSMKAAFAQRGGKDVKVSDDTLSSQPAKRVTATLAVKGADAAMTYVITVKDKTMYVLNFNVPPALAEQYRQPFEATVKSFQLAQ